MTSKVTIPSWNEEFVIGIDEVDLQHEYFFIIDKKVS
jgi:hemerythrin